MKGICNELFFPLYFLEKQDPFSLALSLSSCFPPLPLAHPGTVYCLGEYFMAFASHPHVHSFTRLLSNRMNKWGETPGEAGCLKACFPQQVNPYWSLQTASMSVVLGKVQMDRLHVDPSSPDGSNLGDKGHCAYRKSFINPALPARTHPPQGERLFILWGRKQSSNS